MTMKCRMIMMLYFQSLILILLSIGTNVYGQTVYKTETGKKYHTASHYENSTAITLEEALKLGLEACKVCKPSQAADSGEKKIVNTSSRQCSGTTKAGNRCKRMTTDPSGYCYQHKM